MSETKRQGLKLKGTNGEAAVPHTIPPLPGYYRPDAPTPVGGSGELSLADARAAAKDHSDVLELVSIPAGAVKEAEERAARDLAEGRNAIFEAIRSRPVGADVVRIEDEKTALKEA